MASSYDSSDSYVLTAVSFCLFITPSATSLTNHKLQAFFLDSRCRWPLPYEKHGSLSVLLFPPFPPLFMCIETSVWKCWKYWKKLCLYTLLRWESLCTIKTKWDWNIRWVQSEEETVTFLTLIHQTNTMSYCHHVFHIVFHCLISINDLISLCLLQRFNDTWLQ